MPWFGIYDRLPERTTETQVVQSWDTASKAGEIVGTAKGVRGRRTE